MSVGAFRQEFIDKYLNDGEVKFYHFLLIYAINKLVSLTKGIYKGITPDLEFLEHYHRLIILYRREGEIIYLNMAKIYRKAAHRIYRIMLKKNMTVINYKFLNLV